MTEFESVVVHLDREVFLPTQTALEILEGFEENPYDER